MYATMRHLSRRIKAIALTVCVLSVISIPAQAQLRNKMPQGTQTIVTFGDSLMAGYGLLEREAFPAVLEEELRKKGRDVRVVNMSVSGETAADGLNRIDKVIEVKPRLVLVEFGANDMLRRNTAENVRQTLDTMLTKFREAGVPVLLCGMKALSQTGAVYQDEFDAIYPELAKQHGVALYPFFMEGVAGNVLLNQPDGLHPNAQGVVKIVEAIRPLVEETLSVPIPQPKRFP